MSRSATRRRLLSFSRPSRDPVRIMKRRTSERSQRDGAYGSETTVPSTGAPATEAGSAAAETAARISTYTPQKRGRRSQAGPAKSSTDVSRNEEELEDKASTASTRRAMNGIKDIDGLAGKDSDRLYSDRGKHPRIVNTAMEADNGKLLRTPGKAKGPAHVEDTPRLLRNPERSARRKSTRMLIERTVLGETSDNEDEEDEIAQQIYDLGDEAEVDEDVLVVDDQDLGDPITPSKRGRKPGKGLKNRVRSPSPPQDLPPHELYFSQNRPGRSKTANSNLSSLALLDHDEYFSLLRKHTDPHEGVIRKLHELHAKAFDQWQFELSQNFNLCIYGWGSKRSLLLEFAEAVYRSQTDHIRSKIVIINGYVQTLTMRDVLNTVAAAIDERAPKLGSQLAEMLDNLLALLGEDSSRHITLIIHSIDGAALRRPATQTILARLSSHAQMHLVSSADHPNFPLLWDSSLRSMYNFVLHDCTTYKPYSVEVDVVDQVHELLGRSGRRPGGKDGVSFVLKSLPENAKNLFRVLIAEQLIAMVEKVEGTLADDDQNEDDDEGHNVGRASRGGPGVEYRVLYQKAVEEFICSNEMNFRTLLKEFHDHQMIQSRKDNLGTEILSIPFRKEELESILEDIG